MLEQELVSVIIPTHGRAQYLERAINSVLRQTYKFIEIIIVDDNGDNSKERTETEKVISKYTSYSNIFYITYEKNMNASYARNVGIKKSKGSYIAFLDDDDEMKSDKIKLQVDKFSALDDSWGASYTGYLISKGNGLDEVSCERRSGKLYFEALARSFYICAGSNLMIRRSIINTVGYFDEAFKRNQDLEYLARILKYFKIAYIDDHQLIIHLENQKERKTLYTYKGGIEIDDFYLAKFHKEINLLRKKEQKRIYQYFALERFKRSIGTRYIIDSILNMIKQRVPILLFYKYIQYLRKRKKEHIIYGFKLL